jgi:hypothetical protein
MIIFIHGFNRDHAPLLLGAGSTPPAPLAMGSKKTRR